MVLRFAQRAKAFCSIKVTLSGMVTLVSPVQPSKALNPILVTLSGIVILVMSIQFRNSWSLTWVYVEGIT